MSSQTMDSSLLSASKRDREYLLSPVLTFHRAPACLLSDRKTNAPIYWNAEQFKLDRVTVFQTASCAQKRAILQITTRDILERAYEMETFGVRYAEKAIALGMTLQERTLYSIFKAENTYHLTRIAGWLDREELREFQPLFFPFLADFIEGNNANVLRFIMQVVLEGWELNSYRKFLKACREEKIISFLTEMLKNKSRHHAIGMTLFKQSPLSDCDREILIEVLAEFTRSIQQLPYHLIDAIERVLGDLSRAQKKQAIAELEIDKYNAMQLKRLHFLIDKERSGQILTELETRGCFH
ncbi:MAG: hypothetical protein J7647_24740 [Cyanobacteria bacterium SBLK]|nr:hypothetical protein [Cyanobacteria bacterium SBLK]